MYKSQLIRLLKGCSKKELKRLERYMESPFFNTDTKVIALFHWIKRSHPNYEAGFLAKKQVASKLFPEHPKATVALRRVTANLARLVKDFLAIVQLEKHPVFQQHLLLESLLERNLDSLFLPIFNGIKRELNQHQHTSNYLYNTYLLEQDCYLFTHRQDNRTTKSSFQSVVAQFELIYVVGKLKFCCELLNRKAIMQEGEQVLLIPELMQIITNYQFEKVPIVRLYVAVLQMLRYRKEEHYYEQVRQVLVELNEEIGEKDHYSVCTYLLNYCSYQINAGHKAYWQKMFQLYQYVLAQKLLLKNGYLSPSWFKNISVTAVRLKELEWAAQFITDYQSLLPKQQGESTLYFCKGALAFYQHHFDEALSCFLHVEFADFFDHLNNEMLVMKCYYEQREWALIESRLEALRQYLKRHNAISERHKKAYNNFSKLLKRLMRILLQQEQVMLANAMKKRLQKSITKLVADVKKTEVLIDKEWLLNKVIVLEKKQ